MISLSASVFDPTGTLPIVRPGPGSQLEAGARRITRTATLDGGVAVTDTGYSHGDRTLSLALPGASRAQIEAASRLVRLYPLVTVTLREGAFAAVPESFEVRDGTLRLTLLLTLSLSE